MSFRSGEHTRLSCRAGAFAERPLVWVARASPCAGDCATRSRTSLRSFTIEVTETTKRFQVSEIENRKSEIRMSVYHALLRVAHHVQHHFQKQGRPVPNQRSGQAEQLRNTSFFAHGKAGPCSKRRLPRAASNAGFDYRRSNHRERRDHKIGFEEHEVKRERSGR